MAEKTYKVIALHCTGKGKKIFSTGDIITQANLSAKAEELVKQGFIEECDEPAADAKPTLDDAGKVNLAATDDLGKKEDVKEPASLPAFDDVTKKQIQERLTAKGIVFDEKMNKTKLYDLLK